MKIRSGFVSNSSTSSFICSVCHVLVAERDLGIEDAGMYECKNGHVFCEGHLPDEKTDEYGGLSSEVRKECVFAEVDSEQKKLVEKMSEEEFDDYWEEFVEEYADVRDGCPPILCPVCRLEVLDRDDKLLYLLKRCGLTEETLLGEVKEKFGNFEEFKKFVGEIDGNKKIHDA